MPLSELLSSVPELGGTVYIMMISERCRTMFFSSGGRKMAIAASPGTPYLCVLWGLSFLYLHLWHLMEDPRFFFAIHFVAHYNI